MTTSLTTTIEANLTVPGLHYWPEPVEGREYLGEPHRHLFHVRAEVAVTHDERDVEFHDLGVIMRDAIDTYGPQSNGLHHFGPASCETLARKLFTDLEELNLNVVAVRWSEDAEFSATIRKAAA